jgi:hypothetical protein
MRDRVIIMPRPIKLRARLSTEDLSSSLLSSLSSESRIDRSMFDMAAELIAKSFHMHREHRMKGRGLTPTCRRTPRLWGHDAQNSTTTWSDDEGPCHSGFSNPLLVSVTWTRPKSAVRNERLESPMIEIPGSPNCQPLSSPLVRSQFRPNFVEISGKGLSMTQGLRPKTPTQPKSLTLRKRPDNYFLQRPRRRKPSVQEKPPTRQHRSLTLREATPISIFDVTQVIKGMGSCHSKLPRDV